MTAQAKVVVDSVKCQAYGLCVAIDPDVFEVPDGGPTAVLLRDIVDSGDLEDVEEAIRTCPAQAISLHVVE